MYIMDTMLSLTCKSFGNLLNRTEPRRAVGAVRRCRHLEEADLADLHTGIESDGQIRDVGVMVSTWVFKLLVLVPLCLLLGVIFAHRN